MRDRSVLRSSPKKALASSSERRGYSVFVGGFPCQDLSIAGRQAGLQGTQSGLWKDYFTIIRCAEPDWIVTENVGHTWRRWVPELRRELWLFGYSSVSFRVRASDLGAPHERSRIFVVAHSNSELLRELSRWWEREGWQMAHEFAGDGRAQQMADSTSVGRKQKHSHESGSGGGDKAQGDFRSGSSCRSYVAGDERGRWTAEPGMGRVAHGVPDRVDRLRGLGNAIIPQIAEIIAVGIKEVMRGK